ncbi:NAD(P)-binding protein [Dichomitus squalens]|uniref:NAD(P)-binding protein n=1 Tax=Dichomitus squalens TaxID=114155 RepID=A0A4Q9NV29_9APHY|nr:NAD(P)-binding protein [Dichomitus squalens]TBU56676.1 NAD(P)-binding protein [Dichomitus squalens]
MDSDNRPLVLVVGATGRTGGTIVQGLLASGNFRVATLVRKASLSSPTTEALRTAGVEVRVGDMKDSIEILSLALKGVDILISAVAGALVLDQKGLLSAAKTVGVQRGVRQVLDQKLVIHEFIQQLQLPFTFIDVGWWMQTYLPLPQRTIVPEHCRAFTETIVGKGEAKNLVTDYRRIGTYVARIIADPRTLNRSVIVWEDEVSQQTAQQLAEQYSGEADFIRSRRIYVGRDYFLTQAAEGRKKIAQDPSKATFADYVAVSFNEYKHSMYVLEENTLENAKRLGYLDVQELYPDLPRYTLEQFAREFYQLPEPGWEYKAYG